MAPVRMLPADDELGGLGVAHVSRMWARALSVRENQGAVDWSAEDIRRDRIDVGGQRLDRIELLQLLHDDKTL